VSTEAGGDGDAAALPLARVDDAGAWEGVIARGFRSRCPLPQKIESWPLTSLRHRQVMTPGRLIEHARYHCGAMARRTPASPVRSGREPAAGKQTGGGAKDERRNVREAVSNESVPGSSQPREGGAVMGLRSRWG
jgi:hypothetical protein